MHSIFNMFELYGKRRNFIIYIQKIQNSENFFILKIIFLYFTV